MTDEEKKKASVLPLITALGVIFAIFFSTHQAYLLQKRFESEARPWLSLGIEGSTTLNILLFKLNSERKYFLDIDMDSKRFFKITLPVVFQNTGNQPAQIVSYGAQFINAETQTQLLAADGKVVLTIPPSREQIPYALRFNVHNGDNLPDATFKEKYNLLKKVLSDDKMRVILTVKYSGVTANVSNPYETILTFDILDSENNITVVNYKMN